MLPSWLRQLLKKRFVGQGATSPIRHTLDVEPLEDRTVPTAIWTGRALTVPADQFPNAYWSDPRNWELNNIPSPGEDVIFPALSGGAKPPAVHVNNVFTFPNTTIPTIGTLANSIIDVNPFTGTTDWDIGELQINDDNYHIDAEVANTNLTIRGRILANIPQTLGSLTGLSLIGPLAPVTGQSSNLQIRLTGINQEIRSDNNGVLYISATIFDAAGESGLLKRGSGTIALAGSNAFTGSVRVNEGTLIGASDSAFGTVNKGVAVDLGASVGVSRGADITDSVELTGDGVGGMGALRGMNDPFITFGWPAPNVVQPASSWSGGITLAGNVSIGTDLGSPNLIELDIFGVISGSGDLTKVGRGELGLFADNTYAGNTLIREGNVTIYTDNALSDTGAAIFSTTVFNSAGLTLFSGLTVSENLFLNGNGFYVDQANRFLGGLALDFGFSTWTGSITMQSNASIGAFRDSLLLLDGPLLGQFALTKLDQGNVRIARSNTGFTGNTVVALGTLEIADPLALGTTGTVSVLSTTGTSGGVGTLQLEGGYDFARPLILNGVGFNTSGAVHVVNQAAGGASTISLSGGVNLASTASLNVDAGNTLNVASVISGAPAAPPLPAASLEKAGAGTLIMSSDNTYTGSTALRDGLTRIFASSGLGAGAGSTRVFAGASLELATSVDLTEDITISGRGVNNSGALIASAGASTVTGLVSLLGVGSTRADVNVAAGAMLAFPGVISGDADLVKIGAGEMQIVGDADNTFFANTFVNEGTLSLGKAPGLTALGGPVFVGDGVGGNNSDVLRYLGSDQVPSTLSNAVSPLNVTVNSSGLIDLNGFNETYGGLTLVGGEITTGAAGTLTLGSNVTVSGSAETSRIGGNLSLGGTTRAFDVNSATSLLEVNGPIGNGGPPAGINVTGSGQMTLNGVNTYSGTTTVTGGTLVVGVNNALPDTTVAVGAAGTLTVNGVSDSIGALTGNGALNLTGAAALTTGLDNGSSTFGGVITGAGTLRKTGAGALTLTGNSPAYTGKTIAAGGTVTMLANQGAAAFDVLAGATLSGIGRVGVLTVSPGGTVAPGLAGVGTLNVSAGTTGVTFNGGTFLADLTNGPSSDRLAITGSLNAGTANPTLVLSAGGVTTAGTTPGTVFTILTTTGTINPAFRFVDATGAVLNDGATIAMNGRVFTLNYTTNSVTVTFVGAQVTGTISPSANPSAPGETVTLNVTFAPTNPADTTPVNGTVTLVDTTTGQTIASNVTVTNGTASVPYAFTNPTGPHTVTATFTPAGGSPYQPATATLTQTVNFPSAVTVTTSNGSVNSGAAVTITATVTGSNGTPTGTVTFVNVTTGATLGTATLNGAGQASITTSNFPLGSSTVRATYNGDSTYRSSASTLTQTVTQPPPFYTGAVVIGNFLVLQGNGVPGGVQVLAVPPGTSALFTDMNGDGQGDVILILPNLIVVLNGQTGSPLLLATDLTGDGVMDVLFFNPDGSTSLLNGRTGIRT